MLQSGQNARLLLESLGKRFGLVLDVQDGLDRFQAAQMNVACLEDLAHSPFAELLL